MAERQVPSDLPQRRQRDDESRRLVPTGADPRVLERVVQALEQETTPGPQADEPAPPIEAFRRGAPR
jgi:hypothetical protein